MSRNIVQIIEIRRFEKSDQKNKKTKRDFQTSELRSRSKKDSVYSWYCGSRDQLDVYIDFASFAFLV